MKLQKTVIYAKYNSSKHTLMHINASFSSTNNPVPKDIPFALTLNNITHEQEAGSSKCYKI